MICAWNTDEDMKIVIQLYSNWVRCSMVAMFIVLTSRSVAVAGMAATGSSGGGYARSDVVLLIAYIAIGKQSIKAALVNPVDSLGSE